MVELGQQTICKEPSSQNTILGQPFPVRAIFKYADVAVAVRNPQLQIFDVDSGEARQFTATDSIAINNDRARWRLNQIVGASGSGLMAYDITIDPLSLGEGKYRLKFSGDVVAGTKTIPLVIEGIIGIGFLSRADRIVNYAMELLYDHPEEYLFKPQVHQWKASSLFKYLDLAVGWCNNTKPQITTFNLETAPEAFDIFYVHYVVAEAMFARARLGIENDVTINDTRSIQVETYSKYKGLYDVKMAELKDEVSTWKNMNRRGLLTGLARFRYPVYFQRLLSMIPNFANTFVTMLEAR